jgi:hypothetical protein
VIIAKTHVSARTVLYYVNSALARLKETGAYDAITAKHLEQFWGAAASSQPAMAGTRPPDASSQHNLNPASTGASQARSVKTHEPEAVPQQKSTAPGKKTSDGKKTGQP